MEGVQKIALFIDADNISAKFGKLIVESLEKRGEVFIRRIYGNWEKFSLHKWNDCILQYGLRTVHQIDFASGKNATDMSLAIDAMDVLYKNQATTFAIVSNDSDFTPLAVRLREHGVEVIGIGRKDLSASFRNACNEYISLDSLAATENSDVDVDASKKSKPPQVTVEAATPIEEKIEDTKAQEKIAELERKIAELERKIESPQWAIGLRLTAEENKNSVLQKNSSRIKQNIVLKTLPSSPVENSLSAESSTAVEVVTPLEPLPVENPTTFKSDVTLEIVPLPIVDELESSSTVESLPIVETLPAFEAATEIAGVVVFKPAHLIDTPLITENSASKDENISVELKPESPAQIPTPNKPNRQQLAERDKALNDRFVKCGQNGMRNPKRKMQQIHDVLHETAKLHGDKNGFVPLTFAGQDIKKKNLGFSVQDFGYTLLNEFISDFPDLYELAHSKPRSFRYRCI